MTIPAWLVTTTEAATLPAKEVGWRRADYLEKTLGDIQQIMTEDMYQAALEMRQGFFQSLNPQVKLVGVALLILSVQFTRSMPVLLAVQGLMVVLALVSGISLAAYGLRTWVPVAFFSGIVLVPGIFSWITPGEPLVTIYQGSSAHLGFIALPAALAITKQGVSAAAFVMLRSAASLGLVVLLVKTTRWVALTKAMGRMGVPDIFIMVLDLTYRYLFLFLLLFTDFLWGRKSRLVGVEPSGEQLAWIGSALAGFLRLTGDYTREVTAAMLARGYSGEHRQRITDRVGLADACFIGGAVLIFIAVLGGAQIGQFFGI